MKNNSLVIIFIVIIFLYINKNTIEKMTDLNMGKKMLEEYRRDIDSIRTLATIADKLQSENGLTLPGTLNIPSNLNVTGSFNLLPKGTIVAFNGQTAPPGWAICNGGTVKDVNNQNYVTPDLRGRFIYGYNNSRFGQTGGEENVTLTQNQMPSHNHTMSNSGSHSHNSVSNFNYNGCFGNGSGAFSGGGKARFGAGGTCFITSSDGNHTHTIDNTGGGTSHNNMPPYLILLYIIKL